MKLFLLLAASIILTTGSLQAQDTDQDIQDNQFIEQVGPDDVRSTSARSDAAMLLGDSGRQPPFLGFLGGMQNAGGSGHFAGINQYGAGHTASIDQQGDGNYALMYQFGANNQAHLLQNGAGNQTYLLQSGVGNIFDVDIHGNDNLVGVAQIGYDNLFNPNITASNRHIIKVQVGIGNRMVELGQPEIPMSVEQRGDGMEIIIQHH